MIKTAKTTKEYKTEYKGYDLVVPKGSTVNNSTACGPDDSYRFWQDWHKIAEELTGNKTGMPLSHDLNYYGLNIPVEHCEEY